MFNNLGIFFVVLITVIFVVFSFIFMAIVAIKNLITIDSTLKKAIKKIDTKKKFTLYSDIFINMTPPKTFLLMKNTGDGLCKFQNKIPYIDYDINDLLL